MSIAIGSYIRLLNPNGSDTNYRFQNFFQGEVRRHQNLDYMFGGFGFSGGTLDLQAANISASLAFAMSDLVLSVFDQAVHDRWLVEIHTVWLDPETLDETDVFSEEMYAVTGLEHDSSRLSVRLGSPLDAVSENAPKRALTQALVGSLPTTGQVSLR